MQTHNLGYPRIGHQRELKKACEQYWSGQITTNQLEQVAKNIRYANWQYQKQEGIEWIPCNDFSFYDHVLDICLMTGAIPDRYHPLIEDKDLSSLDLLFAMARGYQQQSYDVIAMEMTKWFDTNYHYIVPEFKANQKFSLFSEKIINEFTEAKKAGFQTKPVLLGPISFLLLGKEKENGFHRIQLLDHLLPIYLEVLKKLDAAGAYYVQIDEPCLSLELTPYERQLYISTYEKIVRATPHLKIILASYFECYGDNLHTVLQLPVHTIHLDLARCPSQLDDILIPHFTQSKMSLSLGVVDGRNIWKNDFKQSIQLIQKVVQHVGMERLWIAPSCSLLHVPCDLDNETNETILPSIIKDWLAFAKQKLNEVSTLKQIICNPHSSIAQEKMAHNQASITKKNTSSLVHNTAVKQRTQSITEKDIRRAHNFTFRKQAQQALLNLPVLPTTTIGSFPQTKEVRNWRAKWKKKEFTDHQYHQLLRAEIEKTIRWQEEAGLDVLVHGEFERNDMVEYFGEQLSGFVFTQMGWVQSYGSRCVKPPIIYGDVHRPNPMTVAWTSFAQSLTTKWVKGMLTGPVTILQWSFVRDDQPRSVTCNQIALAIRDEVADLEKAGIRIIQIDEPAIREGLPLRKTQWNSYLDWAVKAFQIASSGVADDTQIHTHMCYSEFNDIINAIVAMDADVITIECSRSQMDLLDAFANFKYPNDLGPGVYDIHSPRVPDRNEMVLLLKKANEVIPYSQLWVNPDCGLKTRGWEETKKSIHEMVMATKKIKENLPMSS